MPDLMQKCDPNLFGNCGFILPPTRLLDDAQPKEEDFTGNFWAVFV